MRSKTFWNKKKWRKFNIKFYKDGSVMLSKHIGAFDSGIYFEKEDWEMFKKELSAFDTDSTTKSNTHKDGKK